MLPPTTRMTRASKSMVSALTPAGRAAISTIVVRGEDAQALVQRHFRRTTKGLATGNLPIDRIVFGIWTRGGPSCRDDNPRGEEVVVCRRADVGKLQNVEVHCHGGSAARKAILADLVDGGGKLMPWQHWVRAVAPSRTAAEAQLALARSTTRRTARILLDQQQGAWKITIEEISRDLLNRPDHALARLESLLRTARCGFHLTVPWKVALVGPPNVGKSCLTNAIVGYERAIVHEVPGTTRDILTAATAVDGWPVEIVDTAGMQATKDPIEAAGVSLAREAAEGADCLVLVFDASQRWDDRCEELCQRFAGEHTIICQNKLDLVAAVSSDRAVDVCTSALRGDGVLTLLQRISSTLVPQPPTVGQSVVFTTRQQELLRLAVQGLRRHRPEQALERLAGME